MVLKIINKDGNNYILQDIKKNKFNLSLQFFDLEQEPQIDDEIVINAKLLDKDYVEYSPNYIFGDFNSKCGRKISSTNDIDLLALKRGSKVILLKRLFG